MMLAPLLCLRPWTIAPPCAAILWPGASFRRSSDTVNRTYPAQSCQGRALLLPTAMTWQISPQLHCGHRASPPQPYHGLSRCCQLRFSHAAMAWSIVPLGELCHGRSCSFHAAIPGSKLPLSCRRRTHTAMLRLTKLLLLGSTDSTRLLRCSHAMVDHVSPLPFAMANHTPRYNHAMVMHVSAVQP